MATADVGANGRPRLRRRTWLLLGRVAARMLATALLSTQSNR